MRIRTGIMLAAGILAAATALRPQMPAVGPVWEYASVTSSPSGSRQEGRNSDGRATICYAGANGCRDETESPGSEAMMSAAAELGEEGWELAGATDQAGGRILYFKRLRSVLNREGLPESR